MYSCVSVLGKRAAAPEGVSPVQWWILTDYIWGTKKYKLEVGDMRATELLKTTDPQTFSNTPENTTDNIGEGQGEFSSWLVLEYSLHKIFLKICFFKPDLEGNKAAKCKCLVRKMSVYLVVPRVINFFFFLFIKTGKRLKMK